MSVSVGRRPVGIALGADAGPSLPLLFGGRLDEGISHAGALGFDGVELSLRDVRRLDADAIRHSLDQHDLSALAIATGLNCLVDGACLAARREEQRALGSERLLASIDLASALGAPVIVGGIRGQLPVGGTSSGAVRDAALHAVAEAVAHAERSGVQMLLEPINRYETNFVNTVEAGVELIEAIASPNLRLLIDTFHMNIEEASLTGAIRAAAPVLGYVHLADSNRLAPGLGHVPFDAVLGALDEVGYAGPLVAEVLPRPDDFAAAHACAAFLTNRSTEPIGGI